MITDAENQIALRYQSFLLGENAHARLSQKQSQSNKEEANARIKRIAKAHCRRSRTNRNCIFT